MDETFSLVRMGLFIAGVSVVLLIIKRFLDGDVS
jgi:hypothetical protein